MSHHLNLVLHCGGQSISRADLARVPTPDPTDSFRPMPHHEYVNMVQDELENFGLRVVEEAHGVTHVGDGGKAQPGNYFGMFQVEGPMLKYGDHSTVIGLRGSHIKRLSRGLALGSGVFVCDNLAFSGEIVIRRKHTKNLLDEELGVRPMIIEAISKLIVLNEHQERRFEEYKSRQMTNGLAEVVMIDSLREGVITPTQLPKVVEQWDNPDHEEFGRNRNGWRMFNAVTEALKGTSPVQLPQRTAKLHRILDEKFEIEPLASEFAAAA